MQKIRIFIGPLILLVFIVTIIGSTSTKRTTTTKPGFYGISNYWNNGSGDVNGEVGHRMYVAYPTARCILCTNCSPGKWSANSMIVSGSLPPGLTLDNSFSIVGIPTERGHWVVKLKLYDVVCDGKYYTGFEQELRFHITGSGKVNK